MLTTLARSSKSSVKYPRLVVVMTVWISSPISRRKAPRRSPSSSLITSSKSSSGAVPKTSRATATSATFQASTRVRCWPWLANERAERPATENSISSRCGPTNVTPRRISSSACSSSAEPACARTPSPSARRDHRRGANRPAWTHRTRRRLTGRHLLIGVTHMARQPVEQSQTVHEQSRTGAGDRIVPRAEHLAAAPGSP